MTQAPLEPLEPDEDALAEWEKMPKGKPSPEALPPITGGIPNWLWLLIGLAALTIILGLILN